MNPPGCDHVAHLTDELERVQRELAQFRRRSRLQTAVPALVLGAWVVTAGAPAQDDLEQRVSALEARLLKGPGTTTRIQAPFEVVGAGGNVILQVTQALPTVSNGVGIFNEGSHGGVLVSHGGHDIAGMGTAESGDGGLVFIGDQYGVPRAEVRAEDGVSVLTGGGKVVASMRATDEGPGYGLIAAMEGDKMLASMGGAAGGGLIDVSDDMGKSVAQMSVDENGNGYVATLDPKTRYAEAELGLSDKGEPQVSVSTKGKERAALRLSAGAGHLSLLNAKDMVVANVTATGSGDGGAVIVGNGNGKGVASLGSSAGGSGLVQVFDQGGKSIAVMGQDKSGGLLQIKNGSGVAISSFTTAGDGGGYWQLNDPSGNPVVEAGSDGPKGVVRAGPFFKCSATAAMGPTIGIASLPDCIQGRTK
jgi:hypothetical protein